MNTQINKKNCLTNIWIILPEIRKIIQIFWLKIFCIGANLAPKDDKSIKEDINFFNYFD